MAQPEDPLAAKEREVKQAEPFTDKLFRWLPEFVRDVVQDRRRQLLYVERQMQRRLVNEFRAQVRELEPVLHARGRMVGEMVIETFTSESEVNTTYGDVVARSLQDTGVGDKLPVKELASVVDPLISPFIDPFVEGIKAPLNEKVGEIKSTVVHSFVATGGACLVAGFLLGRFLPRGGDGGKGGSGGRR